jgi:hypothetical protein
VGSERTFRVLRGGTPIMNFVESGTTSQIGSTFRSAGLGAHTSSTTPPNRIRYWAAGDNAAAVDPDTPIVRSGFIRRINVGDQDMWDRYTCIGPGTFRFGNGPGSTEMVEFGPLLAGQAAMIRTDPRKRGVVDLSATPIAPQQQQGFLQGLTDLLSFATANNINPLLSVIQSIFGIFSGAPGPVPPQGNLYSLLKGRFSEPIPARSPGNPVQPYYVKVEIEDGNADSQIIAAGTPYRRNPF